MLSLNNLANHINDIPKVWIFEHYANLKESLTGQDVRIRSLFNDKDKSPSMFIYYAKERNEYQFKCFSTGIGGSAIDMVMQIYKIDFVKAIKKIQDKYNRCVLKGTIDLSNKKIVIQDKFKVTDYKERDWNTRDSAFWVSFNIGSSILATYNVIPLYNYTLTKEENGEIRELVIQKDYLYGYFTNKGELYKVYQPKNPDCKFITVSRHIQGVDQLKGEDVLILLSSLKDIMSFTSLRLNADAIAPNSENTLFTPETIKEFRRNYQWIISLLDIDKAGIEAMQKYRTQYRIPSVYLPLSKDLSDSIRDHKPRLVRQLLVPRIDRHLN